MRLHYLQPKPCCLLQAARKRPGIGEMLKHNWLALHQRRRSGRESGASGDVDLIAAHRIGLQPQGSMPLPISELIHKVCCSCMQSDDTSMHRIGLQPQGSMPLPISELIHKVCCRCQGRYLSTHAYMHVCMGTSFWN